MSLFLTSLSVISPGENNASGREDEIISFLEQNWSIVVLSLILLVAILICCIVFLAILWKLYRKDELILKKYKIDPSNEDMDELNKIEYHVDEKK